MHIRSLFVVCLVSLLVLGTVGVAWSATTCTFDTDSATVSVIGDAVGTHTIDRAGDAIRLDGSPCEIATVATTDTIDVTLPEASTLVVDLAGGALAPGLTDEGDGGSEIEVYVTFDDGVPGFTNGAGFVDIEGSAQADHVALGRAEIFPMSFDSLDLNGTEPVPDPDVFVYPSDGPTTTEVELRGNDGADTITTYALKPNGDRTFSELVTTIEGGDGADTIGWWAPDGSIDGGTGVDTLDQSIVLAESDVSVPDGTLNIGTGNIPLIGIENVTGGVGDDSFLGDDGPNVLVGGPGDDRLFGSGGNDVLEGDEGDDQLVGMEGDDVMDGGVQDWVDIVAFGESPVGVTVDLHRSSATGEGEDTLSGFERISGSAFDDLIIGTAASDIIEGGDGDDQLIAGAGPDALYGDGGDDELSGGKGNDHLEPGAGDDHIAGGFGEDFAVLPRWHRLVVDLAEGIARGAEVEEVTSIEGVSGSEFDDRLTGSDADDFLDGRAGDDILKGRRGNDTLWGVEGKDRCEGDQGARDSVLDCEHTTGVP